MAIEGFHSALAPEDRAIFDLLRSTIVGGLPEAIAKIWRPHPVWFLDKNPVVDYSRLKDAVCLMFWSGHALTRQV